MKKNLFACLLLLALLNLGSQQSLAQDNASPLQVTIQELYIGILGRAADWPGMVYWDDQINAGGFTLENTRAAFTDPAQLEYTEIYGGLDFTQLVIAIYENFLERAPDGPGLDYWVEELTMGRVNADQMINAIINAVREGMSRDRSRDSRRTPSRDFIVLENKIAAALYFTEKTKEYTFDGSVREAARAAVADVTDAPDSLTASMALTDSYTGNPSPEGCVTPDVPTIPDGDIATAEEMLNGQVAVQVFQGENRIYKFCLQEIIITAEPGTPILVLTEAALVAASINEEALVELLNNEVIKFLEANPDCAQPSTRRCPIVTRSVTR
jgi:hypothetical protein